MSSNVAISVRDLNKIYGVGSKNEKVALNNISLQVKKGSIFGLLGPNGAGKSTFINILADLVKKTSGHIDIFGMSHHENLKEVKKLMGIVPQELNIDPFFTPYELLEIQAGLFGVPKNKRRTDDILKLLALEDKSHAYARTLSGGMRRRLLIAKAMVHNPEILILDEPTAGVDVELRTTLWENVRSLNKQGVTTILTTHYLEEAEKMCDRIGILSEGNLVALDTTKNLLERIQTKIVYFSLDKKTNIKDDTFESLKIISNEEKKLVLSYEKSKLNIDKIIVEIKKQGVLIQDISTDDGDLEDVFLRLTKN